MADETILDLSTSFDRKIVRIDDVNFTLKHPDEFSLSEQHDFGMQARRLQRLLNKESNLSDKESKQLDDASKDMVRRILIDIDDATLGRMTDGHRLQVVNAFTKLSGIAPQEAGEIEGSEASQASG